MFACCLKRNLNREYHIYLAHIGSVTRSIRIQMGFNLHSHYSYNQIKLPEGCLREFRNITIESDYMCESLPDGPLERGNPRNLFPTNTKLSRTYYNRKHEGIIKISMFEPHRPYVSLKGKGEVNSLLTTSLCALWDNYPCKEFITEDIDNRGIEYIAKYQYVIQGIYNKQPPFRHITVNIVWELKFEAQEIMKHLPTEIIQNLCIRKHPDSGSIYVLHKNANRTYTSLSLKYFFLRHMISVIRQNLTIRIPGFWEQRYSYESLLSHLRGMGASTERVQEWNEEMKNDEELRSFRNTPLSWNRCSLPFSNSRVTIPTIWLSPSTEDNWEFFVELTEKSDWTKGTVVGQLLRDTIQLAYEIEEEICQRWNLE